MAVIKSGATTDQWTIDPVSKAGRVALYDTNGNVISSLTKPDTQATGALGALNAAVTVAMNGQYGAGFQLASGTLVGTLVAEVSYDSGATWNQTQFYDTTRDAYVSSIIFSASNGATAASIDGASGITHARVRVALYTSGTANATVSATTASRGHSVVTLIDGGKATYRFSVKGFTPIAGLFLTIQGSATKTVRIMRIGFSENNAAGLAAGADLSLQRYSSIVGGTVASTPAAAKNDLNDPAATAVVQQYSVTPATQTANGGIVQATKQGLLTSALTYPPPPEYVFTFGTFNARAFVLRGASDWLGLLISAVGATTPTADVWVELTEE